MPAAYVVTYVATIVVVISVKRRTTACLRLNTNDFVKDFDKDLFDVRVMIEIATALECLVEK